MMAKETWKKIYIKVKTNVIVKPPRSVRGRCFIPASPVPTVGRKSAKLEGNVDATQSVH